MAQDSDFENQLKSGDFQGEQESEYDDEDQQSNEDEELRTYDKDPNQITNAYALHEQFEENNGSDLEDEELSELSKSGLINSSRHATEN